MSATTVISIDRLRGMVAEADIGASGYRGHLAVPGRLRSSEPPRILPEAVLGGELAVPCTRDPLQRG